MGDGTFKTTIGQIRNPKTDNLEPIVMEFPVKEFKANLGPPLSDGKVVLSPNIQINAPDSFSSIGVKEGDKVSTIGEQLVLEQDKLPHIDDVIKVLQHDFAIVKMGSTGSFRAFEVQNDGRYHVVGFLSGGKYGGYGEVWLAEDERLERPVAIKVFDSSFEGIDAAFVKSTQEMLGFNTVPDHPNIVKIYDSTFLRKEESNGTNSRDAFHPVLVMEYVSGPSLEGIDVTLLESEPRLVMLSDCANAVDHIHANNAVHRDIKPGQFVVPSSGKGNWQLEYVKDVHTRPLVKMIDMESVKSVDLVKSTTPEEAAAVSSFEYMSPSILLGNSPTKFDDLYSFAATVYYSFTGVSPHSSKELDKTAKIPMYRSDSLRKVGRYNPNLDSITLKKLDEFFFEIFHKGKISEGNFDSASKIVKEVSDIVRGK
ncbi:protein kinase [bacterium]|nr:protein kinase [bacterium]